MPDNLRILGVEIIFQTVIPAEYIFHILIPKKLKSQSTKIYYLKSKNGIAKNGID